jgi:alcohol dehydrogenase class IV
VDSSASALDQSRQTIAAIRAMQNSIGIRQRLRDLGVQQANLQDMAHKSFQIKRLMDLNPRSPSESDLLAILTAAY